MKNHKQILQNTLSGIFAALIYIATTLLRLPVPITQGYIHLGDALILLCVSLLGWMGIPAAAIGSMLADLLSGYTMYCLPTFIIKGLMALVAALLARENAPFWRVLIAYIAAELVMVAGYFLTEWLILGYGLAAAAGALIPNLIQGLSGVVIASLLLTPFRAIYRRVFH